MEIVKTKRMKQIVVKVVVPETEYKGSRDFIISDLENDFRIAIRGLSIRNYDIEIAEEDANK